MSDNNQPHDPNAPDADGTQPPTPEPNQQPTGGDVPPPPPAASPVPPYDPPQQPPQQHGGFGTQPGALSSPPPVAPYGAGAPPQSGGKGLAITALVLAIVGAVLCFIPFASFGGVPIVIVALILAIIALVKKANGKGMSIASLIVAGVGLLAGIVTVFITVSVFIFIDSYGNELDQMYQDNEELFDENFDDDFQLLEQPKF